MVRNTALVIPALLLGSLFASAIGVATSAHAADIEDIDGGGSKKSAKERAQASEGIVREIERGYYLKANAGTTLFLAPRGSAIMSAGTGVALAVGQDFIDKERLSAAWEVMLHQSLNNGVSYQALAGANPNLLVQGDVHTFTFAAVAEVSGYVTRRFSIGGRAGGGVTLVPLLMFPASYETEVVNGTWGGARATVHDRPAPMFLGGPTIEYYTKLSHFSIGADIDITYAIGWELGLNAAGYLKYTF